MRGTYSLHIEFGRSTFGVEEVAINTTFINPIQLSLIVVEIGFSQGPSLSEGQFLELVSDINQDIISWLEVLWNLSLSGKINMSVIDG
jgi:hypothetical protein